MVLAKAFIERNRLKKFISELTTAVAGTQVFHNEKAGNRDWTNTPLGGKTLDEAIDNLIKAKDMLGELNSVIDEANIKRAKALINRIETLKSELSSIQNVIERVEYVKDKDISMANDGTPVVMVNVLDVDKRNLQSLEKQIKKEIMKTEDELAEANATTEVAIPTELQEYLEKYND